MKLHQLLARTGDFHQTLPSGCVWVALNQTRAESENAPYWRLDDWVVSTRAGIVLYLVPRISAPETSPCLREADQARLDELRTKGNLTDPETRELETLLGIAEAIEDAHKKRRGF